MKPPDAFIATRWTLVLRARGQSQQAQTALSELCEAYYAPVIAFLRREGRSEETAREVAHDFFARILSGHRLDHVNPERGRFRSFLLGALKHFVADERQRLGAAKRGGGVEHLSLGFETETSPAMEVADGQSLAPDAEFDRQWAYTLLDRALAKLAAEMNAHGKGAQLNVLKQWLTGDRPSLSQAEAAAQLGMTEGAVKVAIYRLRERFRALVKTEIAETVGNNQLVEEELSALLRAV